MDVLFEGKLYLNPDSTEHENVMIPFELKTGKRQDEMHVLQVMLYNFCFYEEVKDNYYSLLYYTHTNTYKIIKNEKSVFVSALTLRNDIAYML